MQYCIPSLFLSKLEYRKQRTMKADTVYETLKDRGILAGPDGIAEVLDTRSPI